MSRMPRDRREIGFFEHLEELRDRIIRCFVYICVGAVAGWIYRDDILILLRHPAEEAARRIGIEHLPFRVFEPAAGFTIAIQASLVIGIILAAPLILLEVWKFVEPALEDHERRCVLFVWPFAVVLFFAGVVFCYWVAPNAFAFLFRMTQSVAGEDVELTLKPYLYFIMRLMLGFGLAFELPLVMMFAGFIGVVTWRQLLSWWRHAIVVIFIAAAIITPTVDPVNMTILAGPMILLYLLSIGLVAIVQRPRRTESEEDEPGYDPTEDPYGDAGDDPEPDAYEIPGPAEDVVDAEFTPADGDEEPQDSEDG